MGPTRLLTGIGTLVKITTRKVNLANDTILNLQEQIEKKERIESQQFLDVIRTGDLDGQSPQKKRLKRTQAELKTLRDEEATALKMGSGALKRREPTNAVPLMTADSPSDGRNDEDGELNEQQL